MSNDYLTIPEKRALRENIVELTKFDALTRNDRDSIYYICFKACERELAAVKETDTADARREDDTKMAEKEDEKT